MRETINWLPGSNQFSRFLLQTFSFFIFPLLPSIGARLIFLPSISMTVFDESLNAIIRVKYIFFAQQTPSIRSLHFFRSDGPLEASSNFVIPEGNIRGEKSLSALQHLAFALIETHTKESKMNRKIFHSNVFPAFIMWRVSLLWVQSGDVLKCKVCQCCFCSPPTVNFLQIFFHMRAKIFYLWHQECLHEFFHKACDATLCYSKGSILCNSSSIRTFPVGSLSGGSFLLLIIADKQRESFMPSTIWMGERAFHFETSAKPLHKTESNKVPLNEIENAEGKWLEIYCIFLLCGEPPWLLFT